MLDGDDVSEDACPSESGDSTAIRGAKTSHSREVNGLTSEVFSESASADLNDDNADVDVARFFVRSLVEAVKSGQTRLLSKFEFAVAHGSRYVGAPTPQNRMATFFSCVRALILG